MAEGVAECGEAGGFVVVRADASSEEGEARMGSSFLAGHRCRETEV